MSKRDGLYRRQGSPYYWLSRDPVTGKARSTKCRDRAAARSVLAARERIAADPAHHAKVSETIGAACSRLLEHRDSLGKSTDFHEVKLGHWCRIFGDSSPLAMLDAAAFDRYVATRRAERITETRFVSDRTISKEIVCMLTVLRLAKRLGLYQGDLSILRPMGLASRYVPKTRALSPVEIAALLGALEPRRQPFVALAVALGARKGELAALRPEHLDLEAWTVLIPGTKTATSRRLVPILPPFRTLVKSVSAALPLDPWSNYLRDIGKACKRAGIERVTANDLRRTHATLLGTAGVERDVTRRLLGHSMGSTMLESVYDKPRAAELATRAGELGELSRQLQPLGAAIKKASAPEGIRTPDQWIRKPDEAPPCEPSQNEDDELGDSIGPGRARVTLGDDYTGATSGATAPEAHSPDGGNSASPSFPAESTTTESDGEPPGRVAKATETRHSPAALALALAAETVFARARSRRAA